MKQSFRRDDLITNRSIRKTTWQVIRVKRDGTIVAKLYGNKKQYHTIARPEEYVLDNSPKFKLRKYVKPRMRQLFPKLCIVCGKKSYSKGRCPVHYNQWRYFQK